jgi:hypothetical protein
MAHLIDVRDLSVAPFGPNASLQGLTGLEYEDDAFESGGFGSVHRILGVDGVPVAGLLLKVVQEPQNAAHAYATISLLHAKLRDRLGDGLTALYPELLGLPFLVFHARNAQAGPVVAMVMCDLVALGFADMGSDDWDSALYFRQVELVEKLHLAYQFARVFELLDEIGFVHADLKDRSLFLHVDRPQLALIDFDSGFHPKEQPAAATIGALSQWSGYRMRQWIKSGESPGRLDAQERSEEERWSLAAGLFEVLIGMPPYFFLQDGDEASIAAYLTDHDWPEASPDHPQVNPANLPYLAVVQELLRTLEEAGGGELVAAFKRTFKRGYFKPAVRPTAAEWKALLKSVLQDQLAAPALDSFVGDKSAISRQDEEVALRWMTRHHRVVFLNNEQQPFANAEALVKPGGSQEYRLLAVNDLGETTATWQVQEDRVEPVIHYLRVKGEIRQGQDTVELEWSTDHAVEVTLGPGVGSVPPKGTAVVPFLGTWDGELRAVGGFGQVVTTRLHLVRPVSRSWSRVALAALAVAMVLITFTWWVSNNGSSTRSSVAGVKQERVLSKPDGHSFISFEVLEGSRDLQVPVVLHFSGDTTFSLNIAPGGGMVSLPKRMSAVFVSAISADHVSTGQQVIDARQPQHVRIWMVRKEEPQQSRVPLSSGESEAVGRTPNAPKASDRAGTVTYYFDKNGDGVGGDRSIELPAGQQPPLNYVRTGGDLRDNEKLRLEFVNAPIYWLPSSCDGKPERVIELRVSSPAGTPLADHVVTLGGRVPLEWLASHKPTRESTGAYSIRTDGLGRVIFRFRPPSDHGGYTHGRLDVAVSGATAAMSVIEQLELNFCRDCDPCSL